jgi:hypothetical protein
LSEESSSAGKVRPGVAIRLIHHPGRSPAGSRPSTPTPAALRDVTAAYCALVQQAGRSDDDEPGESAGGNLAIELLAAGQAEDLPNPRRSGCFPYDGPDGRRRRRTPPSTAAWR